jgi:hypothetical protein
MKIAIRLKIRRLLAFELFFSKRYIYKSDGNLFFELYNEPLHMGPENIWETIMK